MQLVAVDWFKDTKRIDHVARHKGSVAQVKQACHTPSFPTLHSVIAVLLLKVRCIKSCVLIIVYLRSDQVQCAEKC